MVNLQQKIKEYGMTIWQRKIRLILGALVFVSLFLLSWNYLYDGINKRFILFTMLSLLTGMLIVCPRIEKWYITVPMVLLYLLVVPQKIFQRMELPLHDMNRVLDGAELANILIILLVYAILLAVFQRVSFALAGGNLVLLIIFLINYYVTMFRGTGVSFNDLLATGTALTVIDNYQLTMNSELWYSILYFCFFIVLGFWCDIPGKGKKYHIAVTAVALSYCLCFYGFWNVSHYLEKHELKWYVADNQKLNGFLLSFGISIKETTMEKPGQYSEEKLRQIAQEAREAYVSDVVTDKSNPNIIIIMNEAWSDLRVLGNLETTEAYMPFTDSLSGNVLKGNTYVHVLGGLTANSEFEVLTGDSLAFFTPSVIPYQLQVDHDMYSLARVLGEQNYQTVAMHPSGEGAWNRYKVYDYFGFDDFVNAMEFETEIGYLRGFISDETNFNEIIYQYENREKDKPFFLFDVTIQNHGGYAGEIDMPIKIKKVGDSPAEEIGSVYDAETYINLMKITDDAFRDLVSYFETVEEPTIICMFGDHQPNLNGSFYNAMFANSGLTEEEQEQQKYITPYVIWANYDLEMPEYGDMSANYLGAAVLECAGVELPDYYKFLLQMRKEYPVISRWQMEDLKKEEKVKEYQMLEYNHLIDKDYQKDIYSVVR